MHLGIISKVHVFHCISLAIYNTKKKAFKLKDYSSLIELLINSMLLEQEFLVGVNLFSSYICILPYISKTLLRMG